MQLIGIEEVRTNCGLSRKVLEVYYESAGELSD